MPYQQNAEQNCKMKLTSTSCENVATFGYFGITLNKQKFHAGKS